MRRKPSHPPNSNCNQFYYNYNFIHQDVRLVQFLFIMLPWPRDNEGIFWFSKQATTCPPAYHTQWEIHAAFFKAERQIGKLQITI